MTFLALGLIHIKSRMAGVYVICLFGTQVQTAPEGLWQTNMTKKSYFYNGMDPMHFLARLQ